MSGTATERHLRHLPIVVLLAVDVPVASETGDLSVEGCVALAALEAGRVPLPVDRRQVEPVHDPPAASGAVGSVLRRGERRPRRPRRRQLLHLRFEILELIMTLSITIIAIYIIIFIIMIIVIVIDIAIVVVVIVIAGQLAQLEMRWLEVLHLGGVINARAWRGRFLQVVAATRCRRFEVVRRWRRRLFIELLEAGDQRRRGRTEAGLVLESAERERRAGSPRILKTRLAMLILGRRRSVPEAAGGYAARVVVVVAAAGQAVPG